ncbi:hypothetical protein ACQ4WX_47655 [Streptomyces lasalocidi]
MIGTGVVLDAGGIYWDIRPSHHLPTLEVRVADAALTVDDAVLFAALVRAAAATALAEVRVGRAAPGPTPTCCARRRGTPPAKASRVRLSTRSPACARRPRAGYRACWPGSVPPLPATATPPCSTPCSPGSTCTAPERSGSAPRCGSDGARPTPSTTSSPTP